jgi:hypothetical protein
MKIHLQKPSSAFFLEPLIRIDPKPAGNVLLYVVVLMLIFGVLGVVMVSLFTSSTASTVTRNDTRRARYLSESGVRYTASELREADFEEDIIIDPLNTLTYTLSGAGSFDPNIFSPWFDSDASVDSPDVISISPRLGELPDDFSINAVNGVWVVNYDFITGENPDLTTTRDRINSFGKNGTSLDVDITGDFVAGEDERICLAVEPTEDRAITEGADLYVARDARLFFPPFNGAISINRVDYAYERLVDDPANNRVILENVTASQFPNTLSADQTVSAGTGASPYDMVMAEGTSDGVTWGDAYTQGVNVYDHSLIRPESRKPDITADEFTSNIPPRSPYISVDTDADTLNIGSSRTPVGGAEFDAAFYGGDQTIGGEQDYCAQGACRFSLGVRAFFLLDFDSQGDGITFTLTSFGPPLVAHNSATSVGGDIELSELMGYAGDSRLVPDPDPLNDLDFLATNPDDRGIDPPKIAVEFDTRTDNDTLDYCEDPLNTNANLRTRNDPLSGEKDAVQYVFWGRTNFLNIPCRGLPPPPPPDDINNPLYDDNRHDADGENATEEWAFGTTGLVASSPAIGSDGTIYVISDGKLYAINPDGSQKWIFSAKNLEFSPVYDDNDTPADTTDDTIYAVGSSDGMLHAITSGNVLKWSFDAQGDLDGGPFVGPDGTIYAGRDWNGAGDPGQVIAVKPDGTSKGLNWPFQVPSAVENDIDAQPIVDDNGTPADTTDDTIYAASEDLLLYAINPDGTFKWSFSTNYVTTRASIGADGTGRNFEGFILAF